MERNHHVSEALHLLNDGLGQEIIVDDFGERNFWFELSNNLTTGCRGRNKLK